MGEPLRKFTLTVRDAVSGATARVVVASDDERLVLRIGPAAWQLSAADAESLGNALCGGALDAAREQVRRVEELDAACRLRGHSLEKLRDGLLAPADRLHRKFAEQFFMNLTPPLDEKKEEEHG
jgi:hypothetical protein